MSSNRSWNATLPTCRPNGKRRSPGSTSASSRCRRSRPTGGRARAPTARAARSSPAAPSSAREQENRADAMKKRLLPDIVSITPSNFDDFVQCERRFLNRHLLGLPASDPGASNATGLLAHDMLRLIHDTGSCADAGHVTDVLTGHDADD